MVASPGGGISASQTSYGPEVFRVPDEKRLVGSSEEVWVF